MAKRDAPSFDERAVTLEATRRRKMARSVHAFVRGNTQRFYDWLDARSATIPEGPAIWICGDCHVGNLGPVADARERVRVQIRDLDQTVVGNPAHDLIRLGLSLASAARSSNLPGVTTAKMIEQMVQGYEEAFSELFDDFDDDQTPPVSVQFAMREAARRSWVELATERLSNPKPSIPIGRRFWRPSSEERSALLELFATDELKQLVTSLRSRDNSAEVRQVDAAYWMKGCSSLGRLRFAVLLSVSDKASKTFCLMDIKEATKAAAPRHRDARMPRDNAQRVVEGARRLAPALGGRMRAARLLDRSVVVREIMPQDLKLEIEQLTRKEAMRAARYLSGVIGRAHSRQMDEGTRRSWLGELQTRRSQSLDAPSWLWVSIVQLMATHEGAYLEHCRRYAIAAS